MIMITETAILGDIHAGIRNDDPWYENNLRETIEWFTNDCKKRGIRTCIQLGDWFDVRKGVTQRTMEFMRRDIVPMFVDAFDSIYVLVGNHDLHRKHEITPNSCFEVLTRYEKFHIVEKAETVSVNGVDIDLIPWMCRENDSEILQFIKKSSSPICMGHFELNGYLFYKGIESTGVEPKFLSSYEQVFSGHFHTISSGGNVQYTGTPLTLSMGDANDIRGYWVVDFKNEVMDIVQNPKTYHIKINYSEEFADDIDIEKFKDRIVKMVVSDYDDEKKLNRTLELLESNCHEIKCEYKNQIEYDCENIEGEISENNSMNIIEEQVDNLDCDDKKKGLILKLFKEAHDEVSSNEA